MTGWSVFAWGAVCALGALLFLACAAHHVHRVNFAMDKLEHGRRRRAHLLAMRDAPSGAVVVPEAVRA